MKRLGIFIVTLFALCLFAIPATAATDDFTVTVTIPLLNYFLVTDGNDTVTLIAGDLTAGYRNETLTSDIAIYDNSTTWTATLTSDTAPSGYLLWIDDTDTGQTTGNYTALTTTPTAMSSFAGYGTAGQHDYNSITLLITGLDWTDLDVSGTVYTATVTYTPST